MARPEDYRVRVKRCIEDWVDVAAHSAAEAEIVAAAIPGVVHVFPKSALRSGEKITPDEFPTIQEA